MGGGRVEEGGGLALYRAAAHPSPLARSALLRRIDFIAVRRRMPMPSSHSEQSVSEHIASRRSWRNLMYRMLFLHCQPHNFNKAVEHRLLARVQGARASQAAARP